MSDLEEIYNYLKTINFDGFQFGVGEDKKPFKTVIDSKLFLESHYWVCKNGNTDRIKKVHYDDLKLIYNNFKQCKTSTTPQ